MTPWVRSRANTIHSVLDGMAKRKQNPQHEICFAKRRKRLMRREALREDLLGVWEFERWQRNFGWSLHFLIQFSSVVRRVESSKSTASGRKEQKIRQKLNKMWNDSRQKPKFCQVQEKSLHGNRAIIENVNEVRRQNQVFSHFWTQKVLLKNKQANKSR
jgi:hypothetical protein